MFLICFPIKLFILYIWPKGSWIIHHPFSWWSFFHQKCYSDSRRSYIIKLVFLISNYIKFSDSLNAYIHSKFRNADKSIIIAWRRYLYKQGYHHGSLDSNYMSYVKFIRNTLFLLQDRILLHDKGKEAFNILFLFTKKTAPQRPLDLQKFCRQSEWYIEREREHFVHSNSSLPGVHNCGYIHIDMARILFFS